MGRRSAATKLSNGTFQRLIALLLAVTLFMEVPGIAWADDGDAQPGDQDWTEAELTRHLEEQGAISDAPVDQGILQSVENSRDALRDQYGEAFGEYINSLDPAAWLRVQEALRNGYLPARDQGRPLTEAEYEAQSLRLIRALPLDKIEADTQRRIEALREHLQQNAGDRASLTQSIQSDLTDRKELLEKELVKRYEEIYQGAPGEQYSGLELKEKETETEKNRFVDDDGRLDQDKRIQSLIDKGMVSAYLPGVGKAELTHIDGNQAIKFQFQGSSYAYLLRGTAEETFHVRQYRARTHMTLSKNNGGPQGRDIIEVVVEPKQTFGAELGAKLDFHQLVGQSAKSITFFPRPISRLARVFSYFRVMGSKWDKGAAIWSFTVSGPLQAGVAWSLPQVLHQLNPEKFAPAAGNTVAYLSYFFAVVLGTFASVVKNWENYNPDSRWMKLFFRSFLFVFMLRALQTGDITALMTSGFFLADGIINPFLNSMTSYFSSMKNAADDMSRKNAGSWKMDLPFFGQTAFKKGNMKRDITYLGVQFTPKTGDYFHVDLSVPLPWRDTPLPLAFDISMPGTGDSIHISSWKLLMMTFAMGLFAWGRHSYKKLGDKEMVQFFDDHMKRSLRPDYLARGVVRTCKSMLTSRTDLRYRFEEPFVIH